METEVRVRTATDDDDRPLARLDADAWPAEVVVVPAQGADEPFFTRWRQPADVLVAERPDGELVGYLRLGRHIRIPANAHVLHVEALVVSATARGEGVGGGLLEAGVAEAVRRGVRKLGLRTLSNNTSALRLYRRHGFTEEGRLHAELLRPDGSYADDVWMARWLGPRPTG